MSHIDFEIEPYIDLDLHTFIGDMYGIMDEFILYRHSITTNNKNFLLKILGIPTYVLKIHTENISTDRIRLTNKVHENLVHNQFIGTPVIVTNKEGNLISQFQGMVLILSQYLGGNLIQEMNCYEENIARGLAFFHRKSQKYLDLAIQGNIKSETIICLDDKIVSDFFLQKEYLNISKILKLIPKLIGDDKNFFRNGIVHGQYCTGNLSFGKKLYIFDFEEIGYGAIIIDTVYAAYNCGYKDHEEHSVENIFSFLEKYMNYFPFNKYEKQYIFIIILLCFITELYVMLNEKDRPGNKGYEDSAIYYHYLETILFYKNIPSYKEKYLWISN